MIKADNQEKLILFTDKMSELLVAVRQRRRLPTKTPPFQTKCFNTAVVLTPRRDIFGDSIVRGCVWHVLLSLCLSAVAACRTLKETHCDKWSADVPVMEGGWGGGWVCLGHL